MSSTLNNVIVMRHLKPFTNIASILILSETVNRPVNEGKTLTLG